MDDNDSEIRSRILNIAVKEREFQLVRRAAFEAEKTVSTFLYEDVLKPALERAEVFARLREEA